MNTFLKASVWAAKKLHKKQFANLLAIVVIGVFVSLNNVAIAVATKKLMDLAQKGELSRLPAYVSIFILLLLLDAASGSGLNVLQARLSVSVSNQLREEVFENLTRSDWRSFTSFHSDDIMTRLTSDTEVLAGTIVYTIPDILSLGVNLAAAMAVLFLYEPLLALFAVILGPSGVLLSKLWRKKIRQYHKSFQESESASRQFLHESLQNMLVVKAFQLEARHRAELNRFQQKRQFYAGKRAGTNACGNMALSASYAVGYALALCWGAYRMALSRGTYSFGTISALLSLVGQIQGPFSGLAHELFQLVEFHASCERLMEVDQVKKEEQDDPPGISENSPDGFGILFQNVTFAYGDNLILHHAGCGIRPNEITAVIGPSGEGKTTMLRIILALLRPQAGKVSLTDRSGRPVLEIGPCTRKYITYVPQENTVFSGTIRDNLLCGDPNASDQEMVETLKAVQAWAFVGKLPDGLDSRIGEHGMSLSEGQAQRLSIARALLRKAPVLILDEATSALDGETEKEVLNAVKAANRTCILVTHRMSSVRFCTGILRVGKGGIRDCSGRNLSNRNVVFYEKGEFNDEGTELSHLVTQR